MSEPIQVLHVDDDPQLGDLVATFLKREDDRFTIETADSPAEGLDKISNQPPDCVVSDYHMPDEDGISFLRSVRKDYPELPFILFTGKGSEAIASKAISAGVTDYLQKESGTDQYTVLANRIKNAVERVQAQRQQKRQLKAIETAQEGISILNENGRYLYVNEAFADLHGYSSDELLGEHYEMVYPAEDIPRVNNEILPEVKQTGYWHGETTSLRADGETVDVDHTLALTDDDELVCTVRDISKEKEHKERLQRSFTRLRELFENSPDMINIHDNDGNIIDPNPRLCEKTGYKPSELSKLKIWELDDAISPSEAADLWEGMEIGESRRVKGMYRRRDDSTFPVEVHIQRLSLKEKDRFVSIARDITDRQQRVRELKRYERVIKHLPVGVFRTDIEGNILSVNEALVDIFDAESQNHILQKDVQSLYADEEDRQALIGQAQQANTAEDELLRMETVTGNYIWAEVTFRLIEENGKQYLDGILKNVTDRRRLVRRRKRAEKVFEHTQDALFLIGVEDNQTFRVQRVNRAYEELTGLCTEDIRGKTPYDLLNAEQASMVETQYKRCLDRGEPIEYDEELTINGQTRHWHTRLAPVAEDGQMKYIVGATRDITEEKTHKRELERKRDFLRHTERIANVGSVEANPYTGEVRWTDGTRAIHGVSDDYEPDIDSALNFYVPEDQKKVRQEFKRCVETGKPYCGEYRIETADDEIRWVEFRAEGVQENGKTELVRGVVQDITERKEREQELQKERDKLDEFAGVVSHDLQNPLQIAEGRLELAREDCDSDHLDDVAAAHERMGSLIEDLLALARKKNAAEDMKNLNLAEVAETCWQNVRTADATLQVSTNQTIQADKIRFVQLLENLFKNAITHGGDDVTVTVGSLENGFYIKDDGPGIPEEAHQDIFQAGYSTSEDGTGFGLSIVKGVIDEHGWSISVDDEVDTGVKFDISK